MLVRLTDWQGHPVMVNTDHIVLVVQFTDCEDGKVYCRLHLTMTAAGDEWVRWPGTVDQLYPMLNPPALLRF